MNNYVEGDRLFSFIEFSMMPKHNNGLDVVILCIFMSLSILHVFVYDLNK
jgi:hypothetical protein